MRFLVDAQLPRSLAIWLAELGHDAIHTLNLAQGNRTTDAEIACLADQDDKIVVTKDGDFVHGHIIHGSPKRLLLIATGNFSNRQLREILGPSLVGLGDLFSSHFFWSFREFHG